eukprot:CAMPEP_0198114972 /NCGR_PEP_ID=MMETSP1442-20131203/6198_1 /TAXON_ID= /ORGANISM="Craspedostauros australis, Strain CCMP3328" /LENGTH=95 /DNA_ID=CAMNT_0043772383 /DNA_START=848 /DNA_END=1136 /DNA_ORIENTATION=+
MGLATERRGTVLHLGWVESTRASLGCSASNTLTRIVWTSCDPFRLAELRAGRKPILVLTDEPEATAVSTLVTESSRQGGDDDGGNDDDVCDSLCA